MPAHRSQRRCRRIGCAGPHTRMHGNRRKTPGPAGRQQGGHAGTCRQAGQCNARRVHRLRRANPVDCGVNTVGLALRPAGPCVVPVPAAVYVGQAALLRVENQKPLTRGYLVHVRACGQRGSVLGATMQHHQQRQTFTALHTGRCVQQATPAAPIADRHAGGLTRRQLCRARRNFGPARCTRFTGFACCSRCA